MSTPFMPPAWWLSGTNQNSIPANDNALRFWISQADVDNATTAQPASPSEGQCHIIQAVHTGAQWSAFSPKDLAIFSAGTWYAFTPREGNRVSVAGAVYVYKAGAWTAASGGGGMTNPMTSTGDIIIGAASGAPARLAVGVNGYVLTLAAGVPTWAVATGGFANPMIASGDIIYGGTGGAASRLSKGADGQVLTLQSGVPAWLNSSAGFANPMTTVGDIITAGASGTPQRLPAATNGYVLTLVGGAPAWAAASGGGGLTGFTAALSTASPNATVNASSLIPSGGTTNQVGVYGQKGTGAIQAQVADGSPAGGNVRGVKATDWQTQRAAADQVASGDYSSVLGGYNNKASGAQSAVLGGSSNTASGSNSVASGSGSTASGYGSHSFGTTASASGAAAIALGDNVSANADFSQAGGTYSTTRGVIGAVVHGSHATSVGRHQRGDYIGGITTTNATQTAITSNGAAPVANNQIPVSANYGSSTVKILVVARKSGGSSDSKHWEITLGALRDATTGSTVIVGTPSIVVIGATAGAAAWGCDVVADTAAGAISVRATGAASTSIRWSFRAQTTECEFAP